MEFRHIELANLTLSAANMRGGKKGVDLTNILPSVRSRGVLLPLIVRPVEGAEERFEIVAGKRRYLAAQIVAEEQRDGGVSVCEPLPCALIAAGDDAAALEVSLIENFARLSPSEVENWASFTRLVKEGRTPEDISLTFGLTELQVKRTLALGNLMPRIRSLYDASEIDAGTVRHLTLASKAQQRQWLALLDDKTAYAPRGSQVKAWLFGGASIPVDNALFDVEGYEGEIVTDLFDEQRFFADVTRFFAAQAREVEVRAEAYREAGWSEVVILPVGETFYTYDHSRCPKRKGGRVYITTSHRGDVTFHEGYITMKEARKLERGESLEAQPKRPEITAAIANYADLHRHAAVRSAVAARPSVALRLMVAHAIGGSYLFSVKPDPQRPHNEAIAESIETCSSEAAFDEKRRAVLAMLGFDPESPTVIGGDSDGISALFLKLTDLPDAAVMDVLAIVMGEALESGSPVIETLGVHLGVDMAKTWAADDALLDLIRDKEVLTQIVSQVADETVANANADQTGKVQRGIIRDCLTGANGRAKAEGWVPKWMTFPPEAYTTRCGVGTVSQWSRVAPLFKAKPEDPEAEAEVETEAEPLLEEAA
jgi:ParB family chromosome partitioning protein